MAIWAHLQLLNCRVKSCQQSVADRHATSDFNHFNDFTFPVAMNDKKNHQIKIKWNYNLLGPLLAKEAKPFDLKAKTYKLILIHSPAGSWSKLVLCVTNRFTLLKSSKSWF